MTDKARSKLMILKAAGRGRCVTRAIKEFRKDDGMTEMDLSLDCYDGGWADGYKAGFQQALTNVQTALADSIRAQRSGMMSSF